jgi:hypothetical protein
MKYTSENIPPNKRKIKKGKIGLLFWLISCFSGSVIVVEIERYFFNKNLGFYMSLSEGILLWFIIMILVLLVSSPLILIIYLLVKNNMNLNKVLTIGLSIGFILSYLITLYLSRSYFDAFYIVMPYFFFAFILGFAYLKIERSITHV